MRQAIILAGGRGTRLSGHLSNGPKPMMKVCGKPVLEHQLGLLKRYGFTDIVMFVGHMADSIQSYFGDGTNRSLTIKYVVETELKGTAGAVLQGSQSLRERFLVVYGDTMLNIDLDRFCEFHERNEADVTLFLHPNDHPHDSDLVEIDNAGRVTEFHPYPHPPGQDYFNLVNAGLYIIEKKSLEPWMSSGQKIDFAKNLFPEMLQKNSKIYGYKSPEYIKDMGTPERLALVAKDCESGRIQKSSLEHNQVAVFLDRDGCLNEEIGGVTQADQLKLLENAGTSIRSLNQAGFRTVIVTNQPFIARGELSELGLRAIHKRLETLLGQEGAFVDAIYHCPHHPDRGYSGEIPELKISCECRKPGIGMLKQAEIALNIDLVNSWLIGDQTRDIKTAINAGVRSVLLRTGLAGTDDKFLDRPDYVFNDIQEATQFIVSGHQMLKKQILDQNLEIKKGEIVLIGGLARSGKSTLSSALRDVLKRRDLSAKIVCLDSWLRSAESRPGTQLQDSYDYKAIESFFSTLLEDPRPLSLEIPFYSRKSRRSLPHGEKMRFTDEDVIIVEGVVALDIPMLSKAAPVKIFVQCNEEYRKSRFIKEYSWRGLDQKEAIELYKSRQSEHDLILAMNSVATHTFGATP